MRFAAFAFLSLTIWSCSAWAQGRPIHSLPQGPLVTAKMLAANTGWALTGPQPRGQGYASLLWWTTDGGDKWQEITPPTKVPEIILSVFFLDTRVGWALLEDSSEGEDSIQFDLASTSSAGASWEVHRLLAPELVSKVKQSTQKAESTPNTASGYLEGSIAFADPLHGWIYVCPDLPDFKELLITRDGGSTWQPIQPPDSDFGYPHFVLVSPEVVMLSDLGPLHATQDGVKTFRTLYITRDEAKTWQRVSLPALRPNQFSRWIGEGWSRRYEDPVFLGPKHGFEVVTFSKYNPATSSTAVLFETLDGGATWKAQGLLGNLYGNLDWDISSTVIDSSWLIARQALYGLPMVTILRAGEWDNAIPDIAAGYNSRLQMSFISSTRGWLLAEGALLSTHDGGASWSDVTPMDDTFKPGRLGDDQ